MAKKYGVDLSHWNSISDYEKLKSQIEFVILKAGGHEAGLYKDKTFEERYNKFKKMGVPVGAYFFVGKYFVNAQTGRDYAEEFLSLIKGKEFEVGLWLDNESTDYRQKSGATDAAINFCNAIERAGYYAGIYGSEISVFKDRYQLERLTAYAKWVARYGEKEPDMDYVIWQQSSSKRLAGISGNVDYDIMKTDIISAIKKKKLTGGK